MVKIILERQFHSGLHYINYKGTENIVLIGMIDTVHKFLHAGERINGRTSVGSLREALDNFH